MAYLAFLHNETNFKIFPGKQSSVDYAGLCKNWANISLFFILGALPNFNLAIFHF